MNRRLEDLGPIQSLEQELSRIEATYPQRRPHRPDDPDCPCWDCHLNAEAEDATWD